MFRRQRGNACGYWDCNKRVAKGDFLCAEHYQAWGSGIIDRCPKCGRFKDVKYSLCLDCYFGRSVPVWKPSVEIPSPKQHRRIEYSNAWVDGYMRPDRFFVYILELDDRRLYVGHTQDLRRHLAEDKKQKKSPGFRTPKLQYVEIIATRQAAELRVAELGRLVNSNPDQIRFMIADFHDHMRELGVG